MDASAQEGGENGQWQDGTTVPEGRPQWLQEPLLKDRVREGNAFGYWWVWLFFFFFLITTRFVF